MTPRMCLPSSAWTDWRPKSAARAQSLSTGWRPTMPSARTRSEPRSKRIRADPILIVDLIEADRDDVRTDLVEDRVDVPLVPEERTVHRFEALDHLDAGRLGHNRFVFEPAGGRVPGDHAPQLVPPLLRLAELRSVTG